LVVADRDVNGSLIENVTKQNEMAQTCGEDIECSGGWNKVCGACN
jgi:hypothetical protein